MPPCTFVLLLAKWNTYIRHHCGLHKCLKVINISSSVRLMCLVIGYLCCGLPPSKPPVALVCVCVNIYIVAGCVQSRIQYVCVYVCVCLQTNIFRANMCVLVYVRVCFFSSSSFLGRKTIVTEWTHSKRETQSVCVYLCGVVSALCNFRNGKSRRAPHRRKPRLLECVCLGTALPLVLLLLLLPLVWSSGEESFGGLSVSLRLPPQGQTELVVLV